jgi:hypothetical protein
VNEVQSQGIVAAQSTPRAVAGRPNTEFAGALASLHTGPTEARSRAVRNIRRCFYAIAERSTFELHSNAFLTTKLFHAARLQIKVQINAVAIANG